MALAHTRERAGTAKHLLVADMVCPGCGVAWYEGGSQSGVQASRHARPAAKARIGPRGELCAPVGIFVAAARNGSPTG